MVVVYTVAITISPTTSSTTETVSMNARRRSGKRGPTIASRPRANAVSVDIAVPKPCAEGLPRLNARKIAIGTIIPQSPATTGSVTRRRSRSSPMSNSRRASRPITKKKNAISPEFSQYRTDSERPCPAMLIVIVACQTRS